MAIPVAYQSFKAAGIYRLIYDKSVIPNTATTNTMRLIVGYSDKGPFNTPVLVSSVSEFTALFGNGSKALEKRGVFFHRLAKQCLSTYPCLCLNLKKFSNEHVGAVAIDTTLGKADAVKELNYLVSDIYDTTRFWTLDATKLSEINPINVTDTGYTYNVSGANKDRYINISTTSTVNDSYSIFIRKASGTHVSGFNITVSDWYNDSSDEIPEYLQDKLESQMSDYMAEVYVFSGKFTKAQIIASETLGTYFDTTTDDKGNDVITLKKYVTNAYGEKVDTLQALFEDATSGAMGRYIGSLIPYFKDKMGAYMDLSILFNQDVDTHHLMMDFNKDLLDADEPVNIDLSGSNSPKTVMELLSNGKSSILGNNNSPINVVTYSEVEDETSADKTKKIMTTDSYADEVFGASASIIPVTAVTSTISDTTSQYNGFTYVTISETLGSALEAGDILVPDAYATASAFCHVVDVCSYEDAQAKYAITSAAAGNSYVIMDVAPLTSYAVTSSELDKTSTEYGTYQSTKYSAALCDYIDTLGVTLEGTADDGTTYSYITTDSISGYTNRVLAKVEEFNSEITATYKAAGGEADTTPGALTVTDDTAMVTLYSKKDTDYTAEKIAAAYKDAFKDQTVSTTLVRVENSFNQEIGSLSPIYFKGYEYQNVKPASTSMKDKLEWQNFQLSALNDYKGIHTALLNKSEVDYRYVVDTFETFIDTEVKSTLSYLCKEKQSAFLITNFPSIKSFLNCPYNDYRDEKGNFNVQYVVDGYNKKKAHTVKFSLPTDANGASFCAFYTCVKSGDGYISSIIPSAGLVSNLFMAKYSTRHPYDIVAGPNYGLVTDTTIDGPDYNYSKEELNIIEPFGVNCIVYRPGFGTFINANKTAKQTPVSALSSVNVRELCIYLQDEIENILQGYQWEFNNASLRTKIKDKADALCQAVQNNGGLNAYTNVCDETNNTDEIIDNEMVVLSTHIEPGRGAGKMVQELTIYRSGGLSASQAD